MSKSTDRFELPAILSHSRTRVVFGVGTLTELGAITKREGGGRVLLVTDPGIVAVYFLPNNADKREIRFVEVNSLIGDRNDDVLEPIDFGIDMGMDTEHKLFVLDVTPDQWNRIQKYDLNLPGNWSLEKAIHYSNE